MLVEETVHGPLYVELTPRSAGARATRRELLLDELLGVLLAGFPPGLDLAVVDRDGVILRAYGGRACVVGSSVATTRATLYDLASLTKVVATTTLALWLVDQGRWTLRDSVASWLPGLPASGITLYELLTHTSGLVAHRPFFHLGNDPRAIRRALYGEVAAAAVAGSAVAGSADAGSAVAGAPGGAELVGDAVAADAVAGARSSSRVLYSDLNFMLLGWAVQRCSSLPLDRLFHEVVALPLGMARTRFRPGLRARARIAATELDGDQRSEPGLVWGEVHDGNAFALGGVAGHAGLFAPCEDLSRFVGALLRPGEHVVLRESTIAEMARVQAGAQPDVRGLGWRLEPVEWGDWPPGSFWHTGFTGTSLLVAPEAGVGVVLLTNAVHPTRQLDRQAELRRRVHRAVAGWLL